MKWRRGKGGNRDVVDIRGASGGRGGGGRSSMGGLGGLPIPGGMGGLGGGAGIVGILIYVAIQVLGSSGAGGFNVGQAFDPQTSAPGASNPQPIPPAQDPQRKLKDFSIYVFEDVQKTWQQTFASTGDDYAHAKLVLYTGAVQTGGCGNATSAVGPFYCPGDDSVYLDLSFYDEMERQLGASGDFAWAYVIAHEMGHHVQDVIGTSGQVDTETRNDPSQANALSVRLELQADCYAGVWGSTVYKAGELSEGDVNEALGAASAVGDDRLQRRATGSVNPDSFTHGTSAQRRHWFQQGYRSGDPGACDTFTDSA